MLFSNTPCNWLKFCNDVISLATAPFVNCSLVRRVSSLILISPNPHRTSRIQTNNMYKLDLPLDNKESAAIARRRNMEAQRQSRIFNAKVRTIGVDKQAIDQQILDKKQMEEEERRRSEAFAADARRNDQIAELLQARQDGDVRNLNKTLNDFRMVHQQPDGRREWDLYDPDAKKKDKPARVHDDDPRCGISSIQKFEGEDLNNKAREKFQQEQLREWTAKQKQERDQAEANQREADRLYELKMRELDERAMELAQAEEECRKAINHATKDYNKALENEMNERKRLQIQQELDDNATELANHIYGDILTENPAVAQSAWGPHRVITDRWKGMSPEQIAQIKKVQEDQIREKERLRQEEELRNQEWDRQREAMAKAGTLLDRQQDRLKKELEKQQADDNMRLAHEQKSHKDFLYKEVYTNPPTAAYFMQFNTSSR